MIKEILEKYWGYSSFRENQEEAINTLVKNKDLIYIAKTGDWKSICFQIPAILKEWTSLVISPLKALMKDQVKNLESKGINATYLNSDLTFDESKERFKKLMNWEYDLLYVSPEKLSSKDFQNHLTNIKWGINYFIIDEFDSIDEYWNSWFRPEYLELWEVRKYLEETLWQRIPVWIFTATATPKVREFTKEILDLDNPKISIGDLIWEHLLVDINKYKDKAEKDSYLYWYLKKIETEFKKKKASCIIFCTTRKTVDNLEKQLKLHKFSVAKYHAWMATSRKESSAKKFMENKVDFIICTNAFWRGVDKSDIRYVIHYWVPQNITSYLQEIWRAWRDRLDSNVILLYSQSDINVRRFLCRLPSQKEELQLMLDIFETEDCYIKRIKEYFDYDSNINKCSQCSNCLSEISISVKENENFKVVKVPRKKRKIKKTRRKKYRKSKTK